MAFVKKVGSFFGVASTDDSDTIKEWQDKVERQMKIGEFGISLKRSFSKTHRQNDAKLLSKARQVLSLVEAEQDDSSQDNKKEKDNYRIKEQKTESAGKVAGQRFETVNMMFYTEDELDFSPGEQANVASSTNVDEPLPAHFQGTLQINRSHDESDYISDEQIIESYQNRVYETNVDDVEIGMVHGDGILTDIEEMDQGSSNDSSEKSTEKISGTIKGVEAKNKSSDEEHDEELAQTEKEQKLELHGPEGSDSEKAADQTHKKEIQLRPEDFVYGKDAFTHYKFYTQIERKMEKKELLRELKEKLDEYDWKIQAIDDLVELAKDYYWNPESHKAKQWQALKRRVKRSSSRKLGGSANRRKLGSITEYKPFFTAFIIFAQMVAMAVMCVLAGGFTYIGVQPQLSLEDGVQTFFGMEKAQLIAMAVTCVLAGGFTYIGVQPQLSLEDGVQTFFGMETVHKWTPPNIWIGPDQRHIISMGGVYAPCMRDDIGIQLLYSRQNLSTEAVLGCCEIKSRNTAGTTTQEQCDTLTEGVGVWREGLMCGQRSAVESSVRHVLKPCCVGNKGQCRLLSHKHCTFLDGNFHKTGHEHCSQVNCLQGYCKPGSLEPDTDQPWRPASPGQWWRVPLSLLYHQGIIHVLLVAVAQWLLLAQIERTAGWLRMIIIYVLSGSGALLLSAIMEPYQCHVGGVGAVFGMVGVTLIELVQFWTIIESPVKELIKLLAAVAVFLLCGTLPYLNIFGMLGGLVIGALTGILVLPYVAFSQRRTRVRLGLIVVSVPLLLLIFILLSQVFHVVQTTDSCKGCQQINCVPYTDKMCDTDLWQQ